MLLYSKGRVVINTQRQGDYGLVNQSLERALMNVHWKGHQEVNVTHFETKDL